ncbi:MAG: hypothetical protein JWM52_141 [Candidatus Saccharibacteria bacterium]|nr:hypothetical protein [Candidatus Saccharibacteria bacterium]
MTIYNYLQLQPVDPQDDGTTSDLDQYPQDETIDLNSDIDEQTLDESWDKVIKDLQKDPLSFSDGQ